MGCLVNYLNSVGQVSAHSVAGRHGIWHGFGAPEVRIDPLETSDACFHNDGCGECLETG